MTLAKKYNAKARDLMPGQVSLIVDDTLTTYAEIDEVVFRRSEYLGGMAAVILELVQ